MHKHNRKYKDSVFTDLFGSDINGKQNFLALYNALSGKHLKFEETQIERKIIAQTLYKTYNNDVSMLINGQLIVLIEHQSTINENMPLRCLEYVTHIYEEIVPSDTRYAEKGILSDYLLRKSKEVTNMLCAKYSYKTDMKVRYREGFEDGKMQEKIVAAVMLVNDFNLTPQAAADKIKAPLEKVLEALNSAK